MSVLVICKILGLFVNTLAADGMYSFLNGDNLLQHLQMQFSQKQKTVSQFFTAFSKSRFNIEYFSYEGHLFFEIFLRNPKDVVK